jgi:hypothetical protein
VDQRHGQSEELKREKNTGNCIATGKTVKALSVDFGDDESASRLSNEKETASGKDSKNLHPRRHLMVVEAARD